jgi:hypothetical protein
MSATRDFNKIEMRAVIKFLFLQGKTPKEIHAILTETLACFLPGRAKDLSAPLYNVMNKARFMFRRKSRVTHTTARQYIPHKAQCRL